MFPREYNHSRTVTKALYSEIQFTLTPMETHELIQKIKHAKQSISHMKTQLLKEEISCIIADSSNEISHSRPLRGIIVTHSFTSVWIQAFHSSFKERSQICICSEHNAIDHALSCVKGGVLDNKHSQIRDLDLEVSPLEEVCQPAKNGAQTTSTARGNISAQIS